MLASQWLELKDASKAVVSLGAGESQIVVANSLDIANALSREIDGKLIWTVQALDDSEALVVHNRYHFDGPESWPLPNPRIMEPRDLKGKRVGVW